MTTSELDFWQEMVDFLPDQRPPALISEYVEGHRVLPTGTPFPGYWRNERTPYAVEIMDDMSPSSPIQHSVTMKSRKLGITAAAENVVGYFIDCVPAPIEYSTAGEELAEDWSTRRLEAMIDSLGLRHKMMAQLNSPKSRRTGDKIFRKEFIGGYLDIISSSSKAALRAGDIRVLIRDEIDGRPPLLASGEGRWTEVNYGHTMSWGARKKVMDFSSPTTFLDSEINRLYELGDQRKFLVPCAHCGRTDEVAISLPGSPTREGLRRHGYQELVLGNERTAHGLKGDFAAGKLVEAYYVCDYCHEAMFNHHKLTFLPSGLWVPTSDSFSDVFRSRQISAMYSPVGMFSWLDFHQEYLKALEEPDGMRSFVNIYLGLPFKEAGSRPDLRKVIELRGDYRESKIQDGVLFLTMGVDVQRGSEINPETGEPRDPENPPRLELEVLGIGAGYRTWSVTYKRFEGRIDDPYSGAWEKLNEWGESGGLVFKRADGREFPVQIVFVDSGDGPYVDVVYRFCQRWRSTYPSKGFGNLKRRKKEKGDEVGPANFRRFRAQKIGEDQTLYEISTNYYKTHIYNNLNIAREPLEPQRPGFCNFPVDYGEEYFAQLTAEDKLGDGSFHPTRRRNEALDCRVYALCAGDVWLEGRVLAYKADAKAKGLHPAQVQQIDTKWVLALLERQTAA